MIAAKDAAEEKAKQEAAAAAEVEKEAAVLEKQNESIRHEITALQRKLAANEKVIESNLLVK